MELIALNPDNPGLYKLIGFATHENRCLPVAACQMHPGVVAVCTLSENYLARANFQPVGISKKVVVAYFQRAVDKAVTENLETDFSFSIETPKDPSVWIDTLPSTLSGKQLTSVPKDRWVASLKTRPATLLHQGTPVATGSFSGKHVFFGKVFDEFVAACPQPERWEVMWHGQLRFLEEPLSHFAPVQLRL